MSSSMFEYIGIFISSFGIFLFYLFAKRVTDKSKLRKHLQPLTGAFLAGYLFKMGATILHQDILGLEGYVEVITKHWTDKPPIIGLGILIFACFWFYYTVMLLKGRFEIDGKCARKHDL